MKEIELYLKNRRLTVELADTLPRKAKGLMFRKKLESGKGMLFVFKKNQSIPIWMFGMRIPIDIIWINSAKEVVHIERDVEPCTGMHCPVMKSETPSQYVLEVNAGLSNELGLTINELVSFNLI